MSILDDQTLEFFLYDVLDTEALSDISFFQDHDRSTFDMYLSSAKKLSREGLLPCYRRFDEEAPEYDGERVTTHPLMSEIYPRLAELGMLTAVREYDVGGQQLPFTVFSASLAYLYGANLNAVGFAGLTLSAGHLIESFGSDDLKRDYMRPMYDGAWTGTMALTEPHAGSSLGDLTTTAAPTDDGHYLMRGSKIFISGGDNSFSDNIVHLTLGRIEGAPAGTGGISLFVVPKKRLEGGALKDNDVATTGIVHKLGWRGLPSVMLGFGEKGDCHGYLVGEPNKGLRYMFQMMNEARVGVGIGATATASSAYLSSLEYARDRTQGRTTKGEDKPVAIIEHDDVKRMLLKQKAIVEGALLLVLTAARYSDVADRSEDDDARGRAQALLDLLTPIVKTFPSERGFESCALAVQIHGGYGYTSEYLPEAWLRDQKLNTIHEGTTGIQGLDLLGRKVLRTGGASLMMLGEEMQKEIEKSSDPLAGALGEALQRVQGATMAVGGVAGDDIGKALRHSTDYLEMLGLVVIGWCWLTAVNALDDRDDEFAKGKRACAQYWRVYELPRVAHLAEVIASGDDAFANMAGF